MVKVSCEELDAENGKNCYEEEQKRYQVTHLREGHQECRHQPLD